MTNTAIINVAIIDNSSVALPILLLSALLLIPLGCDAGSAADQQLSAPKIVSPANGSTDNQNAVILEWLVSDGADTYDIVIATDALFASVLRTVNELEFSTLTLVDLEIGVQYFWRVRARALDGPGKWSPTWTFSASSVAFLPPIPFLSFPDGDATGLPTNVNLRWEASPGALSYDLHVSMEPGLDRRVADLVVTGTSQNVRELVNGYTYYWRVRSNNALGSSNWSLVRKFVCVL